LDEPRETALRSWFVAYSGRYRAALGGDPRVAEKTEHSERVSAEAGGIGEELGWPPNEVRTARALGLVHDVGRFSQLAEFGTFDDRHSVDHGLRGREVLVGEGPLTRLDAADRERILDGVRHHNAARLPEGLDAGSLRFARLVRDADKLDIYDGFHRAIVAGGGLADGFMGRLDRRAVPSAEAVKCLRAGRAVPNSAVRSLADMLLWQAGWVFDVNFPATMRRLRSRGSLERIRGHLDEIGAGRDAAEAVDRAIAFRDTELARVRGRAQAGGDAP